MYLCKDLDFILTKISKNISQLLILRPRYSKILTVSQQKIATRCKTILLKKKLFSAYNQINIFILGSGSKNYSICKHLGTIICVKISDTYLKSQMEKYDANVTMLL